MSKSYKIEEIEIFDSDEKEPTRVFEKGELERYYDKFILKITNPSWDRKIQFKCSQIGIRLADSGINVECPYCGSENTKAKYSAPPNIGTEFSVVCKDCGHEFSVPDTYSYFSKLWGTPTDLIAQNERELND